MYRSAISKHSRFPEDRFSTLLIFFWFHVFFGKKMNISLLQCPIVARLLPRPLAPSARLHGTVSASRQLRKSQRGWPFPYFFFERYVDNLELFRNNWIWRDNWIFLIEYRYFEGKHFEYFRRFPNLWRTCCSCSTIQSSSLLFRDSIRFYWKHTYTHISHQITIRVLKVWFQMTVERLKHVLPQLIRDTIPNPPSTPASAALASSSGPTSPPASSSGTVIIYFDNRSLLIDEKMQKFSVFRILH